MWSDKYIGKPYSRRYNCAALACDVAKQELGIDAKLPRNTTTTKEDQAQIINSNMEDFVTKIDCPEDKQVVLLIGRGMPCHIGVTCFINNLWWVLHADSGFGGVIRQRLSDIEREYKVEGFYRWKI